MLYVFAALAVVGWSIVFWQRRNTGSLALPDIEVGPPSAEPAESDETLNVLDALPLGGFDRIITADLSAAENRLQEIPYKKMLLLIGPEGDFNTDELQWLKGKSTESLRFLPQVLRTETAALYALTLALVSGRS